MSGFIAKKYNDGFTLVELAIVLVIIGLLIGGVLQGKKLIENARMKALMQQIKQLQGVNLVFWDKYEQLPGDMATAESRLPGCAAPLCVNGDGNAVIGNTMENLSSFMVSYMPALNDENSQYWRHLVRAGILSGLSMNATLAWGVSHPKIPVGGGYHVGNLTTTDDVSRHVFFLRPDIMPHPMSYWLTPGLQVLSEKDIFRIDMKFDDGRPHTGIIQAMPFATCGSGSNEYDRFDEGKDCSLLIKMYID